MRLANGGLQGESLVQKADLFKLVHMQVPTLPNEDDMVVMLAVGDKFVRSLGAGRLGLDAASGSLFRAVNAHQGEGSFTLSLVEGESLETPVGLGGQAQQEVFALSI